MLWLCCIKADRVLDMGLEPRVRASLSRIRLVGSLVRDFLAHRLLVMENARMLLPVLILFDLFSHL